MMNDILEPKPTIEPVFEEPKGTEDPDPNCCTAPPDDDPGPPKG